MLSIKRMLYGAAVICGALAASAASEAPRPDILFTNNPGTYISVISDNGQWGLSHIPGNEEGSINMAGGIVINLTDMKETAVTSFSGWADIHDITDDGEVVVGEEAGCPAFYTISKRKWTSLPTPEGYPMGSAVSVTPDGKFAVGYANPVEDIYQAVPVAWNLETRTIVDTPNLPKLDMAHANNNQMMFTHISADGRYVLGNMSYSYMAPRSMFSFVYDLNTLSYKVIGFIENDRDEWTPLAPNLNFVDFSAMSPNGRYVTGMMRMAAPVAGSSFMDDYETAFLYDVEADKFTVYDSRYDRDVAGFSVTDDGVVLGASPAVNPYSDMVIRRGNYFYSMLRIFEKGYGYDFLTATNFAVTGKPCAVSADGRVLSMLASTNDGYILKMKESLADAASRVTLLGVPQVSPADGSSFARLTSVQLKFDRDVAVNGNAEDVKLYKGTDLVRGALSANVEGSVVTIRFRTQTLDDEAQYTVKVPAGFITMIGDTSEGSPAFEVNYIGRADQPVQLMSSLPADGSTFSRFDAASNPLLMEFDASVQTVEGKTALFYTEDDTTPTAEFYLLAAGNQVLAYPLTTQYLFKNTQYTVVLPEGSVTDISGAGANKQIELAFHGNYVREVSATDRYLFNSDGSDLASYMLYDGDGLTPAETPQLWGYTDEIPWLPVRSGNESSDWALSSHSMYTPAGQSNDWLVTPQLNIPDADCYLAFDSQSYKLDKTDRLKVYVYESENVYNRLTAEVVADILANGHLVYNEVQSPGASEEDLEGEWKHTAINLADYSGKRIYVAFLNDNNDQSAVFLDNVQVVHDLKYAVALTSRDRLVGAEEISIEGQFQVMTEVQDFQNLKFTLHDTDGNQLGKHEYASAEPMKQGDTYKFTIEPPLSLPLGKETSFVLKVDADGVQTTIPGSVKNLAFMPYKKVAIEEFTGIGCPNCPMGILALDYIGKRYPGHLVPIAIHTYTGDPMNSGLDGYTSFLNLTGAPSAQVNRSGVLSPMVNVKGDYRFTGDGVIDDTGEPVYLWLDAMKDEMNSEAEADLSFTVNYDETTGALEIPVTARFALDADTRNINLLTVVTEDGLIFYQQNNLGSTECASLGEFGKGGSMSSTMIYPFTHNHVARGVLSSFYSGTPGLIPSSIEANKDYTVVVKGQMPGTVSDPSKAGVAVLMIDNDTNRVLNANFAKVGESTGVGSVINDNSDITLVAAEGTVVAGADGEVTLEAYSLTGVCVDRVNGNGTAVLNLKGMKGLYIVKATASCGSKTLKLIL